MFSKYFTLSVDATKILIKMVPFEQVNQNSMLVKIEGAESYKQSLFHLRELLPCQAELSGLVLQILLLDSMVVEQKLISKKVKELSYIAQKCLLDDMSNISALNLNEFVKALRILCSNAIDNAIDVDEALWNNKLLFEETSKIISLVGTFKVICRKICPNGDIIHLMIAGRKGGHKLRSKLNYTLHNLYYERFLTFMDRVAEISTGERQVLRANLQMATGVILTKMDFGYDTYMDQMESVVGRVVGLNQLSHLPNTKISDLFPCGKSGDVNFVEEYTKLGEKVNAFLKSEEILILVLLGILFQNGNSESNQKIGNFFQKLLLKTLRNDPAFQLVPRIESSVESFYNNIFKLQHLLRNVFANS